MRFEVGNDKVSLRFAVGWPEPDPTEPGIQIECIADLAARREYLTSPDLFEYAVNNGPTRISSHDLKVTDLVVADPGRAVRVAATDPRYGLSFNLEIVTDHDEPAVILGLTITQLGPLAFLRMVFPKLLGLQTQPPVEPSDVYGMVPMEIGSNRLLAGLKGYPWQDKDRRWQPGVIGMPYMGWAERIGLPMGMNTMEVASFYAAGGGGLFVADIDHDVESGRPPVQLTMSSLGIAGFWVAGIPPVFSVETPRVAIGVHPSGDWHNAVDYYVGKHRQHWQFQHPPEWFANQGAIYSFSGGGAGGMYLSNTNEGGLGKRLDGSFLNLPNLLTEARLLGTDIVYLWDYWEGVDPLRVANAPPFDPYYNKGDYRPRRDLGGEQDLKEGIRRIHAANGKVIMYVEPFIIFVDSEYATADDQGPNLAGRYPIEPPLRVLSPTWDGDEWQVWPFNHTMVPVLKEWQDHISNVVQQLTDYGADGIFLDSYGWQMNYPMYTRAENKQCWPGDYARGVLDLTDIVRNTIGDNRVVLVETPSGPIGRHCHGGVSADFGWPGTAGPSDRITASPVRYGIPEIRYFSNGGAEDYSLNRLHQIYAAGHGLALCYQHIVEDSGNHVAHIKKLVGIRSDHADALIHGQQAYQLETEDGSNDVAAYCYRGRNGKTILTIVNTSDSPYSGRLRLRPEDAQSEWFDLLSDHSFVATQTNLPISVPAPGQMTDLLVLRFLRGRRWLEPALHVVMSG